MRRHILAVAATALAIGAFSVSPQIATASNPGTIAVSATVGTYARITTNTDASLNPWTTAADVPFTITVDTNDANGYRFSFAGQHDNNGQFNLQNNTAGLGTYRSPYYITGESSSGYSPNYTGPQLLGSATRNFSASLGSPAGLPLDTYSDQLTVSISPL